MKEQRLIYTAKGRHWVATPREMGATMEMWLSTGEVPVAVEEREISPLDSPICELGEWYRPDCHVRVDSGRTNIYGRTIWKDYFQIDGQMMDGSAAVQYCSALGLNGYCTSLMTARTPY